MRRQARCTKPTLGESSDKAAREYRRNKLDLRWRSSCNVGGERNSSAVCHCHDLAPLASAGRADGRSPFFAEAKVASTKHSLRSKPPHSWRSSASAALKAPMTGGLRAVARRRPPTELRYGAPRAYDLKSYTPFMG